MVVVFLSFLLNTFLNQHVTTMSIDGYSVAFLYVPTVYEERVRITCIAMTSEAHHVLHGEHLKDALFHELDY